MDQEGDDKVSELEEISFFEINFNEEGCGIWWQRVYDEVVLYETKVGNG